jgi:hypothetical protein
MRNGCRILVRKPEEKRPHGRPRCSWRIILDWMLAKYVGKVWTGFTWLRTGPAADSCEQGNEPSDL